jgi:hypothetical protein
MTTAIKVKVVRRPVLKLKVLPRIPANLVGDAGIVVVKNGVTYTVKPDYSNLVELLSVDPTQEQILVYNPISGVWNKVSLATLINNAGTSVRVVAEAGTITVGANTRVLIMNRTADESPSNIILPVAASKIGDLKVVDWKGNSGTFPHTVALSGSDKFNGGLSTWKLWADGASINLTPLSGLGYSV